jgi:hypothetical protein
VNAAYKHLDAKLRIAELTLGQWAGVAIGGLVAVFIGFDLQPGSHVLTLFLAVYLGGLPIAAVFVASMTEFNAWLILRSAVRWRAITEPYLPGPGAATPGYRLAADADERAGAEAPVPDLDLASLWGEER